MAINLFIWKYKVTEGSNRLSTKSVDLKLMRGKKKS